MNRSGWSILFGKMAYETCLIGRSGFFRFCPRYVQKLYVPAPNVQKMLQYLVITHPGLDDCNILQLLLNMSICMEISVDSSAGYPKQIATCSKHPTKTCFVPAHRDCCHGNNAGAWKIRRWHAKVKIHDS